MRIKNKQTTLQLAQNKVKVAIEETNERIDYLGGFSNDLYWALNELQNLFDTIRNVPDDKRPQYEELKLTRASWKNQVETIEKQYEEAINNNAKGAAAGAGAGVVAAVLGPHAAMGVATTFGVASTGAAVSSLTGAAATNAALAWLGGGTLAAGGGGVAAGEALLALAGPIGWAIAGISLFAGGIMIWKNKADEKRLERVLLAVCDRDFRSYQMAMVELSERIEDIKEETIRMENVIDVINTYSMDYEQLDEQQQRTLWVAYDLMVSSTQLLTEPIKGLYPKFDEKAFEEFVSHHEQIKPYCAYHREAIIYLANFLYGIELDLIDEKVICKALRRDKELLKRIKLKKKELDETVFYITRKVLEFQNENKEKTIKRVTAKVSVE